MARKIFNDMTGKPALGAGVHTSHGNYVVFENGIRFYALTIAVTANTTTTSAPAGSFGFTSHATGRGKMFFSDGSKWQSVVA